MWSILKLPNWSNKKQSNNYHNPEGDVWWHFCKIKSNHLLLGSWLRSCDQLIAIWLIFLGGKSIYFQTSQHQFPDRIILVFRNKKSAKTQIIVIKRLTFQPVFLPACVWGNLMMGNVLTTKGDTRNGLTVATEYPGRTLIKYWHCVTPTRMWLVSRIRIRFDIFSDFPDRHHNNYGGGSGGAVNYECYLSQTKNVDLRR